MHFQPGLFYNFLSFHEGQIYGKAQGGKKTITSHSKMREWTMAGAIKWKLTCWKMTERERGKDAS